jgi:hypothetical protein
LNILHVVGAHCTYCTWGVMDVVHHVAECVVVVDGVHHVAECVVVVRRLLLHTAA